MEGWMCRSYYTKRKGMGNEQMAFSLYQQGAKELPCITISEVETRSWLLDRGPRND